MEVTKTISPISEEVIDVCEVTVRESKLIRNEVPFYDATAGPFDGFGIRTIKLVDTDGVEGESLINAPIISDLLERTVVPALLHQTIPHSELYHKLYWCIRNSGFRSPAVSLIGAIDIALHDIIAKRRGIGLNKLLGASRNWSECYMSGGSIHLEDKALVEELQLFLETGSNTIKMKVGGRGSDPIKESIRRVEYVRDHLGFGFSLAVDFNQFLSADQTIEFAKAVTDLNIIWIEEPLHVVDLYEIQKACDQSPIDIAYGESEQCHRGFKNLLRAGVRNFEPIPVKLAGVEDYLKVRQLAEENNLAFSSGGYSWLSAEFVSSGLETGRVEFLKPVLGTLEPYLERRAELKNGRFVFPDSEGMYFSVNWDKIEQDGLLETIKRFNKAGKTSLY